MNDEKYKLLNLIDKKKFWKENPLEGNILMKIDGIPEFKMYSNNKDTVVKELFWTNFKGWENTSLHIWNYFSQIETGIILDIGSYSGIYSLIAGLNEKNVVLAFDIQEECIDSINKNISLNKFENITSYHLGLSDRNELSQFHYNKEDDIMTSVASIIKSKNHNSTSNVMLKKGDDLLEELIIEKSIKLIKIDVEGLEFKVIKGMQKTIEKYRPHLLIEINNFHKVIDLKKLLPHDYMCFQIDENKSQIKRIRSFSLFKKQLGRNYLFTTISLKNINFNY